MEHLLDRYERQADDAYAENMDAQRVSPANVQTLLSHIERDEAGNLHVDATLNAMCTTIATLTTEHEQLRESVRYEAEAGTTAWGLADDFLDQRNALEAERDALRAENETLRQRATIAEMQLRCIREGWETTSTAMTRLQLDLMLGNPDARIAA